MKKRGLLTRIFIVILLIAAVGVFALYKVGDKVFEEVIDSQIAEAEKVVKQPAAAPKAPAEAAAPKAKMAVTKEKLEEIKASVTPTDKVVAAKIVLSELSKSDISDLTKLSSGGITAEEKEEMKAIVYSKLTLEEVEQVKAMYYKYMK